MRLCLTHLERGGGQGLCERSSQVRDEVLGLTVWVLPSDLGGGADEPQDSGHDGEFSRFQSILSAVEVVKQDPNRLIR